MKSSYKNTLLALAITFISNQVSARDIILVTYNKENLTVKTLKKLLNDKFKIPEILIQYKKQDGPCVKKNDVMLHLCLDGEKLTTLTDQQETIKKSFPVFIQKAIQDAEAFELPDYFNGDLND